MPPTLLSRNEQTDPLGRAEAHPALAQVACQGIPGIGRIADSKGFEGSGDRAVFGVGVQPAPVQFGNRRGP